MSEKKRVVGYLAGDIVKDKNLSSGLEEYKARLIAVHEGEEAAAEDLQKKLTSKFNNSAAKGDLKISGGFVLLNLQQLDARIIALGKNEDYKESLEQFQIARAKLAPFATTARVGKTYPATTPGQKVS